MSRKSFQRVTLSVELTLPPGVKARNALGMLREAVHEHVVLHRLPAGLSSQSVIKIIKRETIYTN